jgi:hypothetical protein
MRRRLQGRSPRTLDNAIASDRESARVAGAQVAGVSACSSGDQWYYDNNAAPTTIELCPNACGDRAGSIEIFFDCIKV